jgi:glycosyltransferase involved in cell wall biosynthesis
MDAMVFNSRAGAVALGTAFPARDRQVRVIENGKRIEPLLSLERDGVVCLARTSRASKRQDLLIAALARFDPAARPMAKFAGHGTDHPPFPGQVATLGAKGVALGTVTDPAQLLRTAEIATLPTENEGMPNAVIEAWVHGAPLLASSVQGVKELVRHGEDGWLVENTVDAWFEGLVRLLADEPLRRRLAAAGRARAEREFTLERTARNWADLYLELALRGVIRN